MYRQFLGANAHFLELEMQKQAFGRPFKVKLGIGQCLLFPCRYHVGKNKKSFDPFNFHKDLVLNILLDIVTLTTELYINIDFAWTIYGLYVI